MLTVPIWDRKYTVVSPYYLFWFELNNSFHFDSNIQWKRISTNSTPGMISHILSKYLHDNIGTPIHDKMMVFEICVGVDNSKNLVNDKIANIYINQ